MPKKKICTLLPYWLIALAAVCTVQVAAAALTRPAVLMAPLQPTPQVLGAVTSLRGPEPAPTQAQLAAPLDLAGLTAKSLIVFDLNGGRVLAEKNGNLKLPIASLTKLMTALVAYQNLNLNGEFTAGSADVLDVSPSLGLAPGDNVEALDVFNSMLVGSCNDAALALADFTSRATGQDFVGLMNREAASLGMSQTSYANPMGFDSPDNYSTAEDLEKLILLTQKLSAFTDLGRRTGYQFQSAAGKTFSTKATNTLLASHPDVAAIKTGYTNEAHGAMAVAVTIGSHRVALLVLGSRDREADILLLKRRLQKDITGNNG